MRRLAVALPVAMGLVCGVYTILYLTRWEWNRAIIAGLFFIAVEVVVVATLVVERIRRVEARLDALLERPVAAAPDPGPALEAIRGAAPPPTDRFAWLRDSAGRTNVFLPVLLGAGVLASALAWAVEHVARATLTPVRERRLADGLGVLRPPAGLLVPLQATALPARVRPVRRAATVVVAGGLVALAAVGTIGAVDYAADRLQTRPDVHLAGAETVLELELFGAVAGHDPERVLGHLWATCTGPDVFRMRSLPPPEVDHRGDGTAHVRLAAHVGEHAMARLRGCLNDTTLDRVQARVVRSEVTAAGP